MATRQVISPPILTNSEMIRQALRDAVAQWPGYFYGALETINGQPYQLRIADQLLALPSDRWKSIVGGTRCPLATGIQITLQTWPHADGGAIWLYYVVVRDTLAVGIRRFGPGQVPTAQVDARFRSARTTALDLAKMCVTQGL